MAEPHPYGLKRRLKSAALPAAFLAITALIGCYAVTGERGLMAYPEHQELLRRVTADNEAARAERNMWERRVKGLRARTLDADILDQQAQEMLHRAKPDDVIILYPPKEKLF